MIDKMDDDEEEESVEKVVKGSGPSLASRKRTEKMHKASRSNIEIGRQPESNTFGTPVPTTDTRWSHSVCDIAEKQQNIIFGFKRVIFKLLVLLLFIVPFHSCVNTANARLNSSLSSRFSSPLGLRLESLRLNVSSPRVFKRSVNETSLNRFGFEPNPPLYYNQSGRFSVAEVKKETAPASEVSVRSGGSWCNRNLNLENGQIVTGRPDDVLLNISHPLFDVSRGFFPGISYQVSLVSTQSIHDFVLTSLSSSNQLQGQFTNPTNSLSDCDRGSTVTGHLRKGSSLVFNWSFLSKSKEESENDFLIFRLRYRLPHRKEVVFENRFNFPIKKDCEFQLWPNRGNLSASKLPDLPFEASCQISFVRTQNLTDPLSPGLVIKLTKLNVACNHGHLDFRVENASKKHLCGKLEEIPANEREIYFLPNRKFPVLYIRGSPIFSISYKLVDYCYNISLTRRSGSFFVRSSSDLNCNYRIALPFGNQIAISFQINSSPYTPSPDNFFPDGPDDIRNDFRNDVQFYSKASERSSAKFKLKRNTRWHLSGKSAREAPFFQAFNQSQASLDSLSKDPSGSGSERFQFSSVPDSETTDERIRGQVGFTTASTETAKSERSVKFVSGKKISKPCEGLSISYEDGPDSWFYCALNNVSEKVEITTTGNSVLLHFATTSSDPNVFPSVTVTYKAVVIPEIVQQCEFGSVAIRHFCVDVREDRKLSWIEAESECQKTNGHLVSILSESTEEIINQILIHSPKYHDQNSYWIGASDRNHEGDFRWTSSSSFSYTNWFPGWAQYGSFNRQPSDDGISQEDCVELRRSFHLPAALPFQTASSLHLSSLPFGSAQSRSRVMNSFMWNDRDCATLNYFICETPRSADTKETAEPNKVLDCNRTIELGADHPIATVTSPGFPRPYPDNALCVIRLSAPPTFRLVIDFDELVLENESACSYDYVELIEVDNDDKEVTAPRRLCGDWGERLKLLRHITSGSKLRLGFVSDYSRHFPGFKARVSMEYARLECSDDRMHMFNNSCYMIVTYPQVTWHTARDICIGMEANLASVMSPEEERFILARIRESRDYSTNTIYWLGATLDLLNNWRWQDGKTLSFSAWLPNSNEDFDNTLGINCLSIKWFPSPTAHLPSGLYWAPQRCQIIGGYVCKRENQVSGNSLNLNQTINGTEGKITSPNFPASYYHNLDYWTQIVSPEFTRIVIQFQKLDLEQQADCFYDFIELNSADSSSKPVKLCGHYEPPLDRLNFVSERNVVSIRFHSDYSIAGTGFSISWQAVDVSGCPQRTLTAQEGVITSPNFPHFLMPHLDCTTTILAPAGRRIWFEIIEYDLGSKDEDVFKQEKLEINFETDETTFEPYQISNLLNDGAFLSYGEQLQIRLRTEYNPRGRGFKAIYKIVNNILSERIIDLTNTSMGYLLQLNYPASPPQNLDFSQHLIAPVGYIICLHFHQVVLLKNNPEENNLCHDGEKSILEVRDAYTDINGTLWKLCRTTSLDLPPLIINSFLNSIHIRQISSNGVKTYFNVSAQVMADINYKLKLREVASESMESCRPNSCQNGGKCVTVNGGKRICQCSGHYTGMFCALTLCDLEPCLFGKCVLSHSGFQCVCQPGYRGTNCDIRSRPCAENPCEGRGECIERSETIFTCKCHAWWEGPRCERRMIQIPYKPLHERMLQEPFWLGLITVFVVMGIIGIFWCCRRHLPEKLEKLLAEEADRNRHYTSSSSCRTPSVRGDLGHHSSASNTAAVSSNVATSGHSGPPRTPSPRQKRNNSTPAKNVSEKKQLLQQLVAPNKNVHKTKSAEVINLMETNLLPNSNSKGKSFAKKTTASVNNKLEKKVTFEHLLRKVSTEMNAGSEDSDQTVENPTVDLTSPNSTNGNRGSDSLSSSDLAISMRSGLNCAPPPRKAASADSIFAKLRNFSSQTMTPGANSNSLISVSSTPTGSSPQDDLVGTDDSSLFLYISSAMNPPVSSSTGPPESPPVSFRHQGNTIQVSVLDPLSTHSSSSLLHPPTILLEASNKCLSPIRELPTPAPSPALSPIFPRKMEIKESEEDSSIFLSVPTTFYTKVENPSFSTSSNQQNDGKVCASNEGAVPVVTIEEPSPTCSAPPFLLSPGSPPPRKDNLFMKSKYLKEYDKPTSLDLLVPPPTITITYSMSEVESDSESPANKSSGVPSGGMNYLSPFSIGGARAEHASESNLSSSGYSTGPSRCGSNNVLCPSEGEDHPSNSHHSPRRPSPLLRTPTDIDRKSGMKIISMRERSDSETLSDDLHLESNDEGFGTDHIDEKMNDGELKSAKDLELFIDSEFDSNFRTPPLPPARKIRHCSSLGSNLENCKNQNLINHKHKCCGSVEAGLDQFKKTHLVPSAKSAEEVSRDGCKKNRPTKVASELPSIIVESDPTDLNTNFQLSPVSSRSESPLSDKINSFDRFSPMFYGRLTDSDGIYDCSSDCYKHHSKKTSHRKKERKRSKSPNHLRKTTTFSLQNLLDVPGKKHPEICSQSTRSKPSPKRRCRTQQQLNTSTSSSSESLSSIREIKLKINSAEDLQNEWKSKTDRKWMIQTNEASSETANEAASHVGSRSKSEDKTTRKTNRLRTIGHQIRFLRRLEQSLKQSERNSKNDDERLSSVEMPLLSPKLKRSCSSGGKLLSYKSCSPLYENDSQDEPLLAPKHVNGIMVVSLRGHTD